MVLGGCGFLSARYPCRVSSFGLRASGQSFGSGLRIPDSRFGFRVPGSRFWVPGSVVRVPGFRFRFPVSGFQVPGSNFQIPVFGKRITTETFQAPDEYSSRTRSGNENTYTHVFLSLVCTNCAVVTFVAKSNESPRKY